MTVPIALRRDGAIATLLIDNQARRNAMTRDMWRAVPGLVADAASDPAIAVLRVAGAGGHFCGGADIAEFGEAYGSPEAIADNNRLIRDAVESIAGYAKPSIATIHGACVGGGVALALACDLRLAADDARFAVTPVRLGLIYSHADTRRLVMAVGANRAKEMLFSARIVEAAEAARIGLVDRLWTAEAFDAEVARYLDAIAATSRPALRGVKAMVDAIAAGAAEETPALAALFEEPFAGEDFQEGYRAFLDKRPARFSAP
jgi:enoyl-CoA hydratase/carnithine racemase